MVECGSIDQPPSFSNITIWGIITYICMLIVGVTSFWGLAGALGFKGNFLIDLLNIIGCGFGVAGLIFAILSIVQHNGAHMKISMTCYLVACVISLVIFVLCLIWYGDFRFGSLLNLLFCIFLCYLFFVQSKNFA